MTSLRSKLLALTAPGVMLVGLGAFFFIRHTGRTIAEAETRVWEGSVARAAQKIQAERDEFRTILIEYALWDGMVDYVNEPTEDFEEENLGPWLETWHGLDFAVVVNAEGRVIHATDPTRSFHIGAQVEEDEAIGAALRHPGVPVVKKMEGSYVWFVGGSIHNTTVSEFEPPGFGTFLCGRVLSPEYLSDLSRALGRPVTLGEGPETTRSDDTPTLSSIGELPLTGGGGSVRFLLERDEGLAQSSADAFFALAAYFLICVVIGIGILVLAVDHTVVAPVLALRKRVGELRRGADRGPGVPKPLSGEIGQLAEEFHALAEDLGRSLESVSDGKRLADTLTEQRDAAEVANRAKSEFLATMSHEIRNPMNGLLGMTELLLGTPMTERQRHFAETSYRSGQALLSVLDDILVFSKIQAGKLELESIDFNLKELIEEVVSLFEVQARQKGLRFRAVGLEEADVDMNGDPVRLRQVLGNLASNAIKFTDRGEVEIGVSQLEPESDGWIAQFEVRDTGIGVEADKQSLIFERFAQADGSMTRKYGGTGLGLSISKRLVEMMGGEIQLQSAPGRGATFAVTVRLGSAVEPSDQVREEAPLEKSPNRDLQDRAAAPRLLLVEDNPVNAEIASAMLDDAGYRYDIAVNGREALELAFSRRYDAVLMDCHMPEMDGLAATRSIREREAMERARDGRSSEAHLPVIALTAYATASDQKQCREAGMDAHLSKPFSASELRDIVERFCHGARPIESAIADS